MILSLTYFLPEAGFFELGFFDDFFELDFDLVAGAMLSDGLSWVRCQIFCKTSAADEVPGALLRFNI